jgi:hypothetical protein
MRDRLSGLRRIPDAHHLRSRQITNRQDLLHAEYASADHHLTAHGRYAVDDHEDQSRAWRQDGRVWGSWLTCKTAVLLLKPV